MVTVYGYSLFYSQSTIYWKFVSHKHHITFGKLNKNYLRNIAPKKNIYVVVELQVDFQGPFVKNALFIILPLNVFHRILTLVNVK